MSKWLWYVEMNKVTKGYRTIQVRWANDMVNYAYGLWIHFDLSASWQVFGVKLVITWKFWSHHHLRAIDDLTFDLSGQRKTMYCLLGKFGTQSVFFHMD